MDIPWWREAVVYQIYPRSFMDSDGDGIGDLQGIRARLDHLDGRCGGLGVDAVWLSPFYPSPLADGGYDIVDHCDVDPRLGTLDDFDALVEELHERDMRILVDFVPNHTSDEHAWFRRSRRDRRGDRRDWYVWRDPAPDGGPPNNWMSAFPAVGSAWTLDDATGQYYLHSYLPQQPDLNWDNPDVRAAMYDVMKFWFDRDVDGFRIDVVHKIGKDPLLRDDPMPSAPAGVRRTVSYNEDWDTAHERVREMRKVADGYRDRVLVGEVYIYDQQRMAAYVRHDDELDLAHDFTFLTQPWSASGFACSIDAAEQLLPDPAQPAWCLNNHDHSRVATRYGQDGNGYARARLAALLLLTLRGTPFLYQGEELGLEDVSIPADAAHDVHGRDPVRAPMPWQAATRDEPGAGFTSGMSWLPLPPATEKCAIAVQDGNPASILALYRRLLRLRADRPEFRRGSFQRIEVGGDVLAYLREHEASRSMVLANFGAEPFRPTLPDSFGLTGVGVLLASTDPTRDGLGSAVTLDPFEGVVIDVAGVSIASRPAPTSDLVEGRRP